MGPSKWRLGSWKKSLSGQRNTDTTPTQSLTTRMSSSNHKSSSSSGSGSGGDSNKSDKTSSSVSSASSSSPFSWFRLSSHQSKKRRSIISRDDPAFARLHKPFTPQNLEHQKLLSTFEWTFNDDNCRQRRTSLSISPCATRNLTVDDYARGCGYDYDDGYDCQMPPPSDLQGTLGGSLARLSIGGASSPGGHHENPA